MVTMRLPCTVSEIYSLKDIGGNDLDLLGSCDVIGHVTGGLGICGFVLVVHCNHACILHHYGDMEPLRFSGQGLDLLRSRDVIVHVTIRHPVVFPIGGQWSPGASLARFLRYSASNILRSRP